MDSGRDELSLLCAIGASAGGLRPIEEFFSSLPRTERIAFVVVQHLSPDHDSMMGEILARHTNLEIVIAANGMKIRPATVYLIAPGTELTVGNGRLRVVQRRSIEGDLNRPIDALFLSAAREYGQKAAGIVLSGTGTDGAIGLIEIAMAGGLTLVQDGSAEFDGMPSAAVAHGSPDAVLGPFDMAQTVTQFASTRVRPPRPDTLRLSPLEKEIVQNVEAATGVPLSQHKVAPLRRRLAHRVAESGGSIEEYARRVKDDERERGQLLEALLIDVTDFFRDPLAFQILEEEVIPRLVREAVLESRPVRVWVPGCSSGEEAYSIAMLLIEAVESLNSPAPPLQIFATDIRPSALAPDSNVHFSESHMAGVSQARRDRHFTRQGAEWKVSDQLRAITNFVAHDILDDPPFTSLDLVSCRNLLIYFHEPAQEAALATIDFSLRTGGVLFQGPSEHLGSVGSSFEGVSSSWRIWRKVGRPATDRAPLLSVKAPPTPAFVSRTRLSDSRLLMAYDVLLESQVTCGLLLAEDRSLLHAFGDARHWLDQPAGRPTLDAVELVRDRALRVSVLSIVRELAPGVVDATPREVLIEYDHNGPVAPTPSLLQGRRMQGREEAVFLVYATPLANPLNAVPDREPAGGRSPDGTSAEHAQIEQLEAEVAYLRNSLMTALTEQETASEELNASNEELLASNEELQSSNEELSSVNEELRTLNEEHRRRLEQVRDLSADLEQVMSSTEMAVVFLSENMTIRRYNDPARSYFRIRDSDVGRPLAEVRCLIDVDGIEAILAEDVRAVSEFAERRVRRMEAVGEDARELIVQIDRYRLPPNRWGVSISVIDLTDVLASDRELAMFAAFLENAPLRVAVWDREKRFRYLNASINDSDPEKVTGHRIRDVMGPRYTERTEADIDKMISTGEGISSVVVRGEEFEVPAYLSKRFPFEVDGETNFGVILIDAETIYEAFEVCQFHHPNALSNGVIAFRSYDVHGQLVDERVDNRVLPDTSVMTSSSAGRYDEAIRLAIEADQSSRVLLETHPTPDSASHWSEAFIAPVDLDEPAVSVRIVDVNHLVQKLLGLAETAGDDEPPLLDLTVLVDSTDEVNRDQVSRP